MPKNIRIELDEPITGHEGQITAIELRPPVMRDVMVAGVPYTIHAAQDGAPFLVEDKEALRYYAEACLVAPKEYSIVERQVGAGDAMKVRDAIIDFFLQAGRAKPASKTSPPTSPSTSDGPQTQSEA